MRAKSEEIIFAGHKYYVSKKNLEDPSIKKIFMFQDPELKNIVKTSTGKTRMVAKVDIEEVLKENEEYIPQERQKMKCTKCGGDGWYEDHSDDHYANPEGDCYYYGCPVQRPCEFCKGEGYIYEFAGGGGGAGYAVWGGGWGRNFGNPSMGGRFYGRGFGFGQSSSNTGGPNLMYTYDVKPLNQILQQPGTPQGDEREIHVGSEIKGITLDQKKKIQGKILFIKIDDEGDILHYIVLDMNTGIKKEVDPTSVELLSHEEAPSYTLIDYTIGENYYPRLSDILNEKKMNARQLVKRSKLPKEIKEKILKLGVASYKNGRAHGIKKPKVKGKNFNGVSLGADKDGFYVYTHRARSKSYKDPTKISNKDIKFIESTG